MRLSESELSAVTTAFQEITIANRVHGELLLFGSRTSDAKRGGDIDLLWICPQSEIETVRRLKFDLISRIQFYSEPQRIDLTIVARESTSSDPFYRSIKKDLVPLINCPS